MRKCEKMRERERRWEGGEEGAHNKGCLKYGGRHREVKRLKRLSKESKRAQGVH